MVGVTSSNMALLFEVPNTVFDEAGMTNELRPNSASKAGRQDRIAGTTEVGLRKVYAEDQARLGMQRFC